MSENKRIPLPSHLATRDSTLGKDGLLKNFYEESTPSGEMIVKRPGQTNNIALGPCVAQGSTFFNGNQYFICSNVVYVNPPGPPVISLACPVSSTQFGFGQFAIADPKTGYVWVTDPAAGVGVVRVYNPKTQALITTITPPTGAGAAGGLAFIPGTREVIISAGSLVGLTYSHWSVDADLYTVIHKLTNGTGGTYFPYCPMPVTFSGNWVVTYSNTVNGGNAAWQVPAWVTTGSNPFPQPTYTGGSFLNIINEGVWLTSASGGVSIYSNFHLSGSIPTATRTEFAFSGSIDSGTCYDTKRRVIWRVDTGNNDLHFISVAGGIIGTPVLKSVLPYSGVITRICYDPYRDVIWCTGNDTSLIAVNPDTGLIALSCFGKAQGYTPNQNAYTSLILVDSNTLVQCVNNTAGNSLTYIPLP